MRGGVKMFSNAFMPRDKGTKGEGKDKVLLVAYKNNDSMFDFSVLGFPGTYQIDCRETDYGDGKVSLAINIIKYRKREGKI